MEWKNKKFIIVNNPIRFIHDDYTLQVEFISNGVQYTGILIDNVELYFSRYNIDDQAYDGSDGWQNDEYRYITFIKEPDDQDKNLLKKILICADNSLKDTTWVFKDSLQYGGSGEELDLNWDVAYASGSGSSAVTPDTMRYTAVEDDDVIVKTLYYGEAEVYEDTWLASGYKTVTFTTEGTEELFAFLAINALNIDGGVNMQFTQVPSTLLENLQLNAGILVEGFVPSTGVITNLIGATTGGFSFEDTPNYEDFGDDVDNCPKNTKELKRITSRDVKGSGTLLTLTAALAKKLMGAADVASTKITPRDTLSAADFTDLWWVGDYSDKNTGAANAGYVAIHLMNVLNTGGFKLQSGDKAKGQFAFEFTAHYSINSIDVVPYEVYVKPGTTAST